MEFVNNIIFPALATVVTGLATWGVTALVNWLNSKIKNEKIRTALENARAIITAEVAETTQKFVDDLKKDGAFTPDKQKEALQMTIKRVKTQLTAEATKAINAVTDDAEMWINAEIEKAVINIKKGT